MTTTKKLKFEPLEQYQKQHAEYSAKVSAQQAKLDEAKATYDVAVKAYEDAFTESVRTGKDETAKLAKLDTAVDEAKASYEKAARNYHLAMSAISKPDFDTVALVDDWNKTFSQSLSDRHVKPIEERLELARDLIYSALMDYREAESLYYEEIEQLQKIANHNKESGKTAAFHYIRNPISRFKVFGQPNVRDFKGYMSVLMADYNATVGSSISTISRDEINYIGSIKEINKGGK